MNSLCWEERVSRYESQGYRCLTPDWPGRDKPQKGWEEVADYVLAWLTDK